MFARIIYSLLVIIIIFFFKDADFEYKKTFVISYIIVMLFISIYEELFSVTW